MADDTTETIRIVVDARGAKTGSDEVRRALKGVQDEIGSANTALKSMERMLGSMGAGFSTVSRLAGVFGIALSIGGVMAFAKELTQAVGGLGTMAEQLTTNTRYLQGLQYAATGANVKLSDLEVGAAALSRKIGQAAEGNKEAIETFQRLGVKILDAQGAVRPYADILTDSAKALDGVDNANRRAALSYEVFDKAGRKMLTLVPELTKGQDALAEASKRAGTEISPETIKKWDDLGSMAERAMLKWRAWGAENLFEPIKLGFEGIANAANVALAPIRAVITGIGWLKDAGGWVWDKVTPNKDASSQDAIQRIEMERLNIQGQPGSGPALARLDNDMRRATRTGSQVFGGPEPMDLASRYTTPTTGSRDPTVKGAGQSEAERYAKLEAQLTATAKAQDLMTAASARGDVQFEATKVHLDAQQKTLEIYGRVLDDTDPKLVRIEELLGRIARGKAAESFNVATTELQKQNVVLEAQIRLMNEAPEVQAREIAMIKARTEAEKAGAAVTGEMFELRRSAIEQNEELKAQAEDLKKAQELWTEPLKQALRDIQTTAADAFEQMLESGKISFGELGQVFRKIVIRMAAEFMALATVRPVMSVLVNAVSPALGRQMGLDVGSASGFNGGSSFSGSGLSMPGGGFGGFGGSGGFGSFLNWQPFASPVPAGGFESIDALMQSGNVLGQGLSSLTLGQIAGGVGSIGFGAYNLIAGQGLGSKLGGAAGIIGGGLSLAASAGLIGSAFGPIGAGIGLLGGLLGGVLGGAKQEPPTMRATGGLNFSGGRFTTSGGAYGGASSVLGTLGGVGGTMKALLDAAGFSAADSPYGLTYQTLAKGDFSNATTFINGQQWGQGSGADAGLDTGAAHLAHMMLMEPGSGISDFMRRGLGGYGQKNLDHAFSTVELGVAITELKSLEEVMKNLGKTSTAAEQALKAIDDQFKGLKDTANKYGIDTAPIDAERLKQRTKVGTDFAEGLQRQYDDLMGNTAKGQLDDIKKAYDEAVSNNKYLVENVKGATDQILLIEKLFGEKRSAVVIEEANRLDIFGSQMFVKRQALNENLAAYGRDTAAIGANPMATQISNWQREQALMAKGVGDTFGVGSQEYYDATLAGARRFAAQMKAANDNFRNTLEDMERDLKGPGVAAIERLMKQRAADINTALALDGPFFDGLLREGPNAGAARKAWNARMFRQADDFNYGVSQGLLEFTDPLQARKNDLAREQAAAMATARAQNAALDTIYGEYNARLKGLDDLRIQDNYSVKYTRELAQRENRALTDLEAENIEKWTREAELAKTVSEQVGAELAATGNHYASLADIADLYRRKQLATEQQFYEAALGSLEDIIKRLTYGDLSGASPTLTLAGTKAAYQSTLAQALAGDQTGLQNLSGAAADYVSTARGYFASSTEYYALVEEIRTALQQIDTRMRGGGSANDAVTTLPAASADLARKDAQIAAMLQAMDKMMVQQEETNAILKRLVVYA